MADVRPVRLQLSRRKGFNLQALSRAVNGLPSVKCTRPGKWGNPFVIDDFPDKRLLRAYEWRLRPGHIDGICLSAAEAVRRFTICIAVDEATHHVARQELRDKNLACFCRLCERHALAGKPFDEDCGDCSPCHCDPLGRIANRPLVCEEVKP